MFKNLPQSIKKVFTGESLEEKCKKYVESHAPKSAHEVEKLEREFWISLTRARGHYLR